MTSTDSNRYVYGVIESDDTLEFEADAVGDANRVYTISHRRYGAIVSDIDTTEPEETDEDANRHDEVLREVMTRDGGRTVVPMQFGMSFENDRALKNVLRNARPMFRRALGDIEGSVELGLKLVREADASVEEGPIEESVGDALDPIAQQSVANDRFSDRLVLNRSYLVDETDRDRFDSAVSSIDNQYDELLTRYTGPFAPYSFVDVRIGVR